VAEADWTAQVAAAMRAAATDVTERMDLTRTSTFQIALRAG
jgi:hypothetical protein